MFNWPIQTSSSVNICFLDFVLTNMNRRKLRNYKFLCPKLGFLLAIYHKMPEHYRINTYKFVKPKQNSSNKVCLPIYWRRYQICAFPERLEWAMLPYKATEAIMLKTTLEFGKCANFETLLFGLRKWSTEIGNLLHMPSIFGHNIQTTTYYICNRCICLTYKNKSRFFSLSKKRKYIEMKWLKPWAYLKIWHKYLMRFVFTWKFPHIFYSRTHTKTHSMFRNIFEVKGSHWVNFTEKWISFVFIRFLHSYSLSYAKPYKTYMEIKKWAINGIQRNTK